MNTNPEFLDDYLIYMKAVKGRLPRTIIEYEMDIRLFLKFVMYTRFPQKDDKNLEDIDISLFSIEQLQKIKYTDIYAFIGYLIDDRKCSGTARARKISSLKSFFKYLTKDTIRILEVDPTKSIDSPRIKQAMPKYLSIDESVKMLENVKTSNTVRDYCIITLFLNCGMRLAELVGINIDDINFSARSLRLRGKGNKERFIYINDSCVDTLKSYIEIRPKGTPEKPLKEPNALFISKQRRRITRRRVEMIVEEVLKEAELAGKGYSPHKLRHTAATLMYQFGDADMLILQQILGHAHVSTTEIYTHISNRQVAETMSKIPLAGITQDN